MRISDWSSDVCSSDLVAALRAAALDQFGQRGVVQVLDDRRLQAFAALAGVIDLDVRQALGAVDRSEERRVGKECVSTCRSRWSPSHSKKKKRNSAASEY